MQNELRLTPLSAAFIDKLKGPQNLLKLGITLSELGEKDQGCTMLNGIQQQYPNASKSVIQKAKYEKKKFKCQKTG